MMIRVYSIIFWPGVRESGVELRAKRACRLPNNSLGFGHSIGYRAVARFSQRLSEKCPREGDSPHFASETSNRRALPSKMGTVPDTFRDQRVFAYTCATSRSGQKRAAGSLRCRGLSQQLRPPTRPLNGGARGGRRPRAVVRPVGLPPSARPGNCPQRRSVGESTRTRSSRPMWHLPSR